VSVWLNEPVPQSPRSLVAGIEFQGRSGQVGGELWIAGCEEGLGQHDVGRGGHREELQGLFGVEQGAFRSAGSRLRQAR
jgi:hypothetical protein